jgi:CHAD domain-containing protein
MSVRPASSKWIEGLSAEQPVVEAARTVLGLRLGAVWELLPAAALNASEDTEHVHQLRVASRRAHAALLAFADCLPRRRGRKMERELHRVRRAAGEARDFDVQQERQQSLASAGQAAAAIVAERIARRRAEAQAPIVRVYGRLRDKDYPKQVNELLARLHSPREASAPLRLGEFAAEQLRLATKRFFDAEAFADADYESLHRFRIRAKGLRYTLEIFASALGEASRKDIYPRVEQVQELLGSVVDGHVAIERYEAWQKKAKRGEMRAALRELIAQERIDLASRLESFRAAWTADSSGDLRERITRLGEEPNPAPTKRPRASRAPR